MHIFFFQGEGFLTIETLSSILLELEPSLGKDELQDIIDEVDEDGSGTIDFDGKNNHMKKQNKKHQNAKSIGEKLKTNKGLMLFVSFFV